MAGGAAARRAAARGAARRVLPGARRALPAPLAEPFSFLGGLVLLGGVVYRHVAPAGQVHYLLAASSADPANLLHRPLAAPIAGACWLTGRFWVVGLLAFLYAATALERRVGPLRALGVFLAGHLVATLATELPVALAVLTGGLAQSPVGRLDIGAGYGVLACLGALAGLVPVGRQGRTVAAGVVAVVVAAWPGWDPVTAFGYPLAYLVGVLLWPRVRRWVVHREIVIAQSEHARGNRVGGPAL